MNSPNKYIYEKGLWEDYFNWRKEQKRISHNLAMRSWRAKRKHLSLNK